MKYRAKKCEYDGIKFDSLLERDLYLHLLSLKAQGLVTAIECQPKVYLTEARILFKPDFKITLKQGLVRFIEGKGLELPTWRLKKRLWKFYATAPLQIYKRGPRSTVVMAEELHPITRVQT